MENGRILIVDDAKINRGMLKIIFDSGYKISEAEDGEKAIRLIEKYDGEIDLLLLDLNMPKKNGFEVLQYMKENNFLKRIPVIVITSSTDLDDELMAYNSGADEMIRKPFVPEIILRRAENLMELYASRRRLAVELKERMTELQGSKKYDALTGLLNMQEFINSADQLLQEADEVSCQDYRFIYSNIRNFKYYNVKYGMEKGDQILKRLADYISRITSNILCARFGQDHMVILTKNEHLKELMKMIRDEFEHSFGYTGMHIKAGVYRIHGKNEKASAACEFAKLACDSIRSTMDYYCEYDEQLSHHIEVRTYAIQHIDEAIRNDHIQVYYQPVIRTITGKTCGMEALARWIDPQMGFLSPGDFIPALEENHQIAKLDLHILRLVCRDMMERMNAKKPIIPISFNLSRYDFSECDIFYEVDKIVLEYGVPRDMINIEITESAIIDNPEAMRREISRFRKSGYQVWMDDFGSGYSSLNVLKDYQFDEIKLDMKFMSSFDEKSKKIVRSIISMAKSLGIQTMAEGVETQEQYDFLRYIGCEKVQGFLFSRPLPLSELEESSITDFEKMESRVWKDFYNRVGASDFVTDKPLSIIEYDGENFNFIYVNDAYKEVWKKIGSINMQMIDYSINSPSSPLSKQFRDISINCHQGDILNESYYFVRGHYVKLNAKCLAEQNGKLAFEVEILNLTNTELDEKNSLLENTTQTVFSMFDEVYAINLKQNTLEIVKQRGYKEDYLFYTGQEICEAVKIAPKYIAPEQQDEYQKFIDLTTIHQRIREKKRYFITKYFRSLTSNGNFDWKAHTILYTSDTNTLVYCICTASLEIDNPDNNTQK